MMKIRILFIVALFCNIINGGGNESTETVKDSKNNNQNIKIYNE